MERLGDKISDINKGPTKFGASIDHHITRDTGKFGGSLAIIW